MEEEAGTETREAWLRAPALNQPQTIAVLAVRLVALVMLAWGLMSLVLGLILALNTFRFADAFYKFSFDWFYAGLAWFLVGLPFLVFSKPIGKRIAKGLE